MYVLVYLAKGDLPWQGLKAKNKHEKNSMIMEAKMATPEALLCKNLPIEFYDVMIYVRALEFEEKPNYEMIRSKFKNVYNRIHINKKEEIFTDWQIVRKNRRDQRKKEDEKKMGLEKAQQSKVKEDGFDVSNLVAKGGRGPPGQHSSKSI